MLWQEVGNFADLKLLVLVPIPLHISNLRMATTG
jgi:hypothetical protein